VEIILFTIVAVALYLFSDWLVRTIEQRRGAALPNRSLVFFAIITVLALASFEFIQRLLQQTPPG
jgi:hypothetical protein